MKRIFYAMIPTVVIVGICAADVVLVEDGQPKAAIVVGAGGSQQARQAAEELQTFLSQISGATLPIVETPSAGTAAQILVGQAAARDTAGKMGIEIPSGLTYQFDEEGYVVVARDDVLILAGNETDPYEGTFYAVYDFLHSLGCRWYFPGDFGQVLPRTPTIRVESIRRVVKPVFRVRDMWYSGHMRNREQDQRELEAWKRRNRMCRRGFWLNATLPEARFLQNPVDDSTYRLLPKEKYWDSHRDYYALNADGTRNDRFVCMTHPGAIQAAADTIIQYFKSHPDHYAFAFSPPDAPMLCYCPRCTKAMHGGFGGEGKGDVSDPYFAFVVHVADKVRAVCPDRWVATMAYYNRCRPPEGVYGKRPNLLLQTAFIQQCKIHSYLDHGCWSRRQFAAMLRRWSQLVNGIVYYEYDPHDWSHLHQPLWRGRGIADDLRLLKELNGWGFSDEGQMAWLMTGLNYYVRASLAWDLEQKVPDIERDFCNRFFGPAGEPMRAYYTTVEQALRTADTHFLSGLGDLFAVLNRPLLDRCGRLLEEASAKADDEPYASRVAAFRAHFDRLDACEKFHAAMVKGDYRQAADWAEAMVKAVNRVNNPMLLMDSGSRGGRFSGRELGEKARALAQWTDGPKGKLLAVLPSKALFRTDPASQGVVFRWYRPDLDTKQWRVVPMTAGWQNAGVVTPQGRRYEGVAWYRSSVRLKDRPAGRVGVLIPELKGSAVWVWCNGRFAGYARTKRDRPIIVDCPTLLKKADNLIVFRVKGDGGLTLPPVLFAAAPSEAAAGSPAPN